MTLYFTADQHFGHRNIIEYCGRPFDDEIEMDRTMINRWNDVVGPEDTVYHLGDFCMPKKRDCKKVLSYLNGKKVLIRGNHDLHVKAMLEIGFDEVYDYKVLKIGRQRPGFIISMCHYPNVDIDDLLKKGMNVIFICGHVHEKWKFKGHYINVGVDQWDFKPISLKTLMGAWKELAELKEVGEFKKMKLT